MNLTPYLKPERKRAVKHLQITEFAKHDLIKSLAEQGVPEFDPGWWSYVAESAATVVQSLYMKRSIWFQEQPAHTFSALRVNEIEPALVLVRKDKGWEIQSQVEHEVPEDYHVKRVIEEVKAEFF